MREKGSDPSREGDNVAAINPAATRGQTPFPPVSPVSPVPPVPELPTILLRDIELPKHVLIEGVVNIQLDPIQTNDALLELL